MKIFCKGVTHGKIRPCHEGAGRVHKLYDLLPIGQTIAGWLFQEIDLEWLKKEYYKMLDFFKDSPAYAWMTEEALERGRAEGFQQGIEGFRQVIVALVKERFPDLELLARRQVALTQNQEHLQQVILRVSLSQDGAEIERLLLGLSHEK
jgi:hypothetical protein